MLEFTTSFAESFQPSPVPPLQDRESDGAYLMGFKWNEGSQVLWVLFGPLKDRYVVLRRLGLYSYRTASGFQEAHLSATVDIFHNEKPSRCARKIPPFPACPAPSPPPNHTHSWGELAQDGPRFSSGLLVWAAV